MTLKLGGIKTAKIETFKSYENYKIEKFLQKNVGVKILNKWYYVLFLKVL